MRRRIELLLIAGLAMILSQIPLQAPQADGCTSCTTGKDQPIWQIYKPRKAKPVCCKDHRAKRRFRIYTAGTSNPSQVYFCGPESPWQHGYNDNANGPLRQYFPKGMEFSKVHQNRPNAVARQLNERPGKTLNHETPAERSYQRVASTV